MEEITKEEFTRYEIVRKGGLTNMFNVRMVEAFSGLERDKIVEIIKNYDELKKKYTNENN